MCTTQLRLASAYAENSKVCSAVFRSNTSSMSGHHKRTTTPSCGRCLQTASQNVKNQKSRSVLGKEHFPIERLIYVQVGPYYFLNLIVILFKTNLNIIVEKTSFPPTVLLVGRFFSQPIDIFMPHPSTRARCN